MWTTLLDNLRQSHALFDEEVRAWRDAHVAAGGRVWCARGCSNCCSLAVNCTLGEALLVAETLDDPQAAALEAHLARLRTHLHEATDLKSWLRLHRSTLESCPFLDADGACGIYAVRPFSCRALLSTRNAAWCAADFAALHPLERQAFLSGLDRRVVAFPTHYVAATGERGRELEEEAAAQLATRFGFAVTGNLPVLVWLERERRLSEALRHGYPATRALLAREGLDHPCLIDLG